MARTAVSRLEVIVGTKGVDKLPQLSSSLRRITLDTKSAGLNTAKLAKELREYDKTGARSINKTRQLAASWKELANNVEFGSRAFKHAQGEAKRLTNELNKMGAARSGRFGAGAKIAGAVAGSAVFGGPAGALGAIGGGIFGGVEGAVTGGAYGAMAGQVLGGVSGTATYAADIKKQRMALRLVIGDNEEYAKTLEFLTKTSKELAIPQEIITRRFTSLAASVTGAGLTVDDARESFVAIASGIRGTGGSLEDMRSALVATSQVFSKGKVSAEELRQQLGERLPGAFTLFAESMGKTPAELDKALEQGKVTLKDFLNFTTDLTEKYGENAILIAQSTFAAGDRMETSLSRLKESMGTLIQPIGAQIQIFMTDGIEALDKAIKGVLEDMPKLIGLTKILLKTSSLYIAGWVALSTGKAITTIVATFKMLRKIDLQRLATEKAIAALKIGAAMKNPWVALAAGGAAFAVLNAAIDKAIKGTEDLFDAIDLLGEVQGDKPVKPKPGGDEDINSLREGAKQYLETIKTIADNIQDAVSNAFKKMEDSLVNFVMTGKLQFKEFARSIIADITRIIVKQAIMRPIVGGLFPGLGFAKGGVFAQNGVVPFARGGVVDSPHVFPFKNGIGLLGEAGPEAIMPLRRGPGGRLGVEASGNSGGIGNISVSVDASGSNVEGDGPSSSQLGKLLGSAVQAELIKQKRPGGILY